ncbi:hypothetical protein EXIGLDRAFT_716442 [Exidia glandulosa HHB12029]|uniref:F-box domain-containing protein n=1 Tax=Exidia glandulosa HHB12029 TaxID=1314781 RepID=A0A166BK01_EXIGL|nr:hypothetical protein EXIGLDRAFT_716442 [Exidia glandulosa HHB12029]
MQRDPNRFVGGFEASIILARLENERAELAVIEHSLQQAELAHGEAASRLREAEELSQERSQLLGDAVAYLHEMRRRHGAQLRAVAAQSALLHPVRKLPPEILGAIFEFCLQPMPAPTYVPFWPLDVRARQLQPFRLAAICRRWRAASLCHSGAWSHLDLAFDPITENTVDRWQGFLATCAQRSRLAPLTVCLTRHRIPLEHDRRLLAIVMEQMRRCISIQIVIYLLTDGDPLCSLLAVDAPKLAHVRLDMQAPAEGYAHLFPNSHIVHLFVRHAGDLDISSHNLDCAIGLASFTICYSSGGHFQEGAKFIDEILRRGENVSLVLSDPIIRTHRLPSERIICYGIVSLAISLYEDTGLGLFGRFLNLPNLHTLALDGTLNTNASRLDFFFGLGPLPSLELLEWAAMSADDFARLALEILPKLSTLTNLIVYGATISAATLSRLCEKLSASASTQGFKHCPTLSVLKFDGECKFEDDCDENDFIQLAKARLGTGPRTEAERVAYLC